MDLDNLAEKNSVIKPGTSIEMILIKRVIPLNTHRIC